MNTLSKDLLTKLKTINDETAKLDNISRKYNNQNIPHNFSNDTLYLIEKLHYTLSLILSNFYIYDLTKGPLVNIDHSEDEINNIISSPFGLYQYQFDDIVKSERLNTSDKTISNLLDSISYLDELLTFSSNYAKCGNTYCLDKKVFFYTEQMHERVSTILLHLYIGDINHGMYSFNIMSDKARELTSSPFAEYKYDSCSYLYNEELINEFSLKDKYFNFNLSNSCYRNISGRCSLEYSVNEVNALVNIEYLEEINSYDSIDEYKEKPSSNSILYCRNLRDSILKNGVQYPVKIFMHPCGHFSFVDGQHRSCIASKENIKIPALVSYLPDDENLCDNCIKYKNQLNNNGILLSLIKSILKPNSNLSPRRSIPTCEFRKL